MADAPELPDYLDDVHQDIAEFYDRHADFLDEDFIDGMLEARGYQRATRWALPDQQGNGGGGGGQRKRPGARPAAQQRRSGGGYFGSNRARS